MKDKKPVSEPRLRIVVSPFGIERVEVWGQDEFDQDVAMELYFKLSDRLRQLNDACRI